MSRNPNIYGGGSQTNKNGLSFEQTTSLDVALRNAGYEVHNNVVYCNGNEVGMSVPQAQLYSRFLTPRGINYANYNSKAWRPDEAFINYNTTTAYIIEKKFQNCSGSVDEKLPSCHFKKWEYTKLFSPLGFNVEFIYIFNDWFKDPRYRDTLDYIKSNGCHYFYNEIPLDALGLQPLSRI